MRLAGEIDQPWGQIQGCFARFFSIIRRIFIDRPMPSGHSLLGEPLTSLLVGHRGQRPAWPDLLFAAMEPQLCGWAFLEQELGLALDSNLVRAGLRCNPCHERHGGFLHRCHMWSSHRHRKSRRKVQRHKDLDSDDSHADR